MTTRPAPGDALGVNREARDLVAAFKRAEQPEAVAALINDDGFDAAAVRVLVAWTNAHHEWKAPPRKMPDEGRPTPRAWEWLFAGLVVDHTAIADAANVGVAVARAKLGLLIGNRLVYPDGTISAAAKAGLQASVAARVKQSPKRERATASKKEDVN